MAQRSTSRGSPGGFGLRGGVIFDGPFLLESDLGPFLFPFWTSKFPLLFFFSLRILLSAGSRRRRNKDRGWMERERGGPGRSQRWSEEVVRAHKIGRERGRGYGLVCEPMYLPRVTGRLERGSVMMIGILVLLTLFHWVVLPNHAGSTSCHLHGQASSKNYPAN